MGVKENVASNGWREDEIKTVRIHSSKYNNLKTLLSQLAETKDLKTRFDYTYTFQNRDCFDRVEDIEIITYFLGHKPEFNESCEKILKKKKVSPFDLKQYVNEQKTPVFFIQRTGIPADRFQAIENDLCTELLLKEKPAEFQLELNVDLFYRNAEVVRHRSYRINDVENIYEQKNFSDLEKSVLSRICVKKEDNEARNKLVKKYSVRYNRLIQLLAEYPLSRDAVTEFRLSHYFSNQAEYMATDPKRKMLELSKQNEALMKSYRIIKRNRNNLEWIMSQSDVHNQTQFSSVRHLNIPYEEFISTEKKLCILLVENAKVDLTIYLDLYYKNGIEQTSGRYKYDFETLDELLLQEESSVKSPPNISPSGTPLPKVEVSKSTITPSLRYNTLKRDQFRCVLCGATARDGAKLDAYLIQPLPIGAKLNENHLRTLCSNCNRGVNTEAALEERSKMSPSLRDYILKRDGYRCVLCGATEKDGARLHVDHIMPVSKGGKTVAENLRTLCDRCNLGKHDKFDENGMN